MIIYTQSVVNPFMNKILSELICVTTNGKSIKLGYNDNNMHLRLHDILHYENDYLLWLFCRYKDVLAYHSFNFHFNSIMLFFRRVTIPSC